MAEAQTQSFGATGGLFAASTRKNGLNMYDAAATQFQPHPDGPYEHQTVRDQHTAQEHFNTTREIKLKDRHGNVMLPTSYKDHYPGKSVLPQEPLPEDLIGPGLTMSFTAVTEYNDQYWNKPRALRPVEPLTYQHKPPPWLLQETTNQATYKAFGLRPQGTTGSGHEPRDATQLPEDMPSIWETTYKTTYVPKQASGRVPVGAPEPRAYPPWMAKSTTYQDHYVPKELALQPVFVDENGQPYPFSGITEYTDQYFNKDAYPVTAPLTGVVARNGIRLPFPRRSLGVEFWHNGQSDKYYVLIPRTADVPAKARQVFTTVHDNQEQACILVLYGDDPQASSNELLGQFDIVGIPPARKGVPRIEVTFYLDKECYLTVEARDLDAGRHKLWQQRGEIVVLKP